MKSETRKIIIANFIKNKIKESPGKPISITQEELKKLLSLYV